MPRFLDFSSGSHQYDKQLSTIRYLVARKCKRSRVSWSEIESALESDSVFSPGAISELLNSGQSEEEVIDRLASILLEKWN